MSSVPLIVDIALLAATVLLLILWRRAVAGQDSAEWAIEQTQAKVRQAEYATARGEAQVAALLSSKADPLILLSPERQVYKLNPAAAVLFEPHAVVGQSLMLATHSIELDELVEHAYAGGADLDRQVTLGRQPYRARVALAGERGEYGAVLSLRDLSELQRLGRARRDFVANISHELRTPITSIRLLVDTLRSGAAAPDTRDSLLEKVSIETETLAQLSQELLDLAQIESGQVILRLVPTPARALMAAAAARLDEQRARKRHTLTVSGDETLAVLADPDAIGRVLVNLLHNAIKFTPAGGQIQIRVERAGDMAQFSVQDSGEGIAAEHLPRIFERFYRIDRSRTTGGTGLGLAIAKHTVETHGGRIWAESEGRSGRGAVFHFTLPLSDRAV